MLGFIMDKLLKDAEKITLLKILGQKVINITDIYMHQKHLYYTKPQIL